MKNKLLFIFTLLFFGSLFSQVPTFITSQKYSAVGAGASGVPSVTFNVPAGKNRLMVVNALVERHHNPLSSNHPTTPNSGGFYRLDINFNSNTYSAAAISTARGPGMTANEVNERVFTFTQFTGLINLETNAVPEGSTTITFPNLNLPGAASDEMSVIISVYENVKGTRTSGNFFPRTNDTSETSLGTFTGNFNTSFIPVGRTLTDVMFVTNTGITQASALTLTPGSNWTSSANMNNIVPNTVGWPAGGNVFTTNNTPIGISSVTAHTIITSGQPSYTLTRANTGSIEAGIASMYALIPFASPSVIGNVFQDHNGPANIDGIGTNAGGLYVNVINNTGNLVYSAAVNASGVFTIPSGILTEGNTYSYQLSKNTGTIGATAPLKELPASWYTVGESRNPTGNDGMADGTISFKLGDENVSGLNFEINATCLVSTSNPDSDGDGVADDCDLDDDNDGILDTAECSNTINDLVTVYGAGGLIDITPSDFGLALGVRNQNVSADLSSKFGYPANSGAVIVSINDASVHPTSNAWWIKNGEQPSVWNVSGKMSTFVLMSQNPEYYGQDSKTIHIYDGAGVIPITVPGLANQTAVPGTWSITETPFAKTLSNLRTEQVTPVSPPGGNWRYANMNFGAKTFGFSTTTKYADPTYSLLMYLECDTDGDGIPNRLDLDSDNDGCVDALEGGANFVTSNLVNSSGTVTVGFGSTASNQNLGNVVNANGIPQFTTVPASYNNTTGQSVGDSQNATINSCPTITCTSESSMLNSSSVSATQSGGNGQQAFIIDNDVAQANYWQSSAAGQSLTIDYGQSYTLNGLTYYPSTTGSKVLGYTIQTSTDNVTFTTAATGAFPNYNTTNLAEKGIPDTVRFTNPVNARYLRMIVADSGKRVAEIVPLVCGLTPIDMTCERVPLVSTGTNATATAKKAVRNLDNNWTVTQFNGGTASPSTSSYNYSSIANAVFYPAIVVGQQTAVDSWATGIYGNADWISATQNAFDVNSTGPVDTSLPNTYFYKYKFNVSSALDLAALKIRLDFYVDNQVVRIYVNGVDQSINTTDFQGYATGHEKSVFLKNNFQIGTNELVIQVYSQPSIQGILIQGLESCYCVKDPIPGIPQGYTKVGITNQNKQEAWPENIPNGHIALESKKDGFVITRVNHVSTVPAPTDSIAEPKEGMVVYDIVDKCVKLFNGANWNCIQRTCNDSN